MQILNSNQRLLVELSEQRNHLPNYVDVGNISNVLRKFLLNFRPINEDRNSVRRFGSIGDGGYSIKIPDFNNVFLMSIGIDNNCDFENDLMKLGGKCIAFDPFIKSLPEGHSPKIILEKIGLFGNDLVMNLKHQTLSELIDSYANDLYETYNILKIDCEGAEWFNLDQINIDKLEKFHQIIIEFHNIRALCLGDDVDMLLNIGNKLSDKFYTLCVVPNQNSDVLFAQDLLITDTFEITLVNKRIYGKKNVPTKDFTDSIPNPPYRIKALDRFYF
jgi:hypothetical protein